MSGGPVPVWKKYTTGSTGIWEKIRQVLTLVPNRSTGNPLVQYYRVPSTALHPGAATYKDPVTIPAADIRNNSYFARDHRRNFPRTTTFNQTKLAGLLELGSAAQPRIARGTEGEKQLAVFTSSDVLFGSALAKLEHVRGEVLGASGQAITAPLFAPLSWRILKENEHGIYEDDVEKYPVRLFRSTN